ncbi:MAG: hypothetical protein HS105_05795 [Chloracidobacterium sp.]|nr:hypothetical protein [Chloracidobacterium sp.]
MASLTSLNNLLYELPFSVISRNAQKDISDFFAKLRDSEFVSGNKKINLISYNIGELHKEEVHKWTVTKGHLRHFFFYSLNERYSLPVLSAYFGLREHLFGKGGNKVDNAAMVLSRLFVRDVGFRLSYDADSDDWEFGYVEPLRAFSIKLPLSRVFNEGIKETHFRNAIGSFVKNIDPDVKLPLKKHLHDDDSLFELTGSDDGRLFDAFKPVGKCFRSRSSLSYLKREIVSGILAWHNSNPGFLNTTETKPTIENWVEIFFQVLLISLVYKSWIEYFPAPCGILHHENIRLYRNLGGLIVGYKLNDQLSQEERAIFRLISSRITAAAAIQETIELGGGGSA